MSTVVSQQQRGTVAIGRRALNGQINAAEGDGSQGFAIHVLQCSATALLSMGKEKEGAGFLHPVSREDFRNVPENV